MINYIFLFASSLILSFSITPLVKKISVKLKIFDYPSERKIHKKPVPVLGGIPVFIAFNVVLLIATGISQSFRAFFMSQWKPIFIVQFVVLGVGIYDDIKKIKPIIKLILQVLSGLFLVLLGVGIDLVTNPFTGQSIRIGKFSAFLTILWIVGIMNAINLIDGLDGLATGTAFIASVTIFGISFFYQNAPVALISAVLAGCALGFLRYNFYPAKIFLGDSGSLFIGFILAVLSLKGVHKGATAVAVLAPILALGFPIIDTVLSIIRRILKSFVSEDQTFEKNDGSRTQRIKILSADKDHIHHRLLDSGLSHKKAVVLLYGVCLLLSVIAFVTVAWKNINAAVFLGAVIIAVVIGIRGLHYQELKIFETGMFLPLFRIPLLSKRFFQAVIDLFIIALSFYLGIVIGSKGFTDLNAKQLFIQVVPYVLLTKLLFFHICGLYKGSWRYSSLEDLIKIVNASLLASTGTVLILVLAGSITPFGGISPFILDFYFSLSLISGSRFSFRIIEYYYQKRNHGEGEKILIYGAGKSGFFLARQLQYDDHPYSLVGFIDDNVSKKGKTQHNIPILGQVEDIEQIVNKIHPSKIIISSDKIEKDKIEFLNRFCRKQGISLAKFETKTKKIV